MIKDYEDKFSFGITNYDERCNKKPAEYMLYIITIFWSNYLNKCIIVLFWYCNIFLSFYVHLIVMIMSFEYICIWNSILVRPTVIEAAVYVNSIGPVDPINMVSRNI